MRKRFGLLTALAVAASLGVASSAGAATQVGNNCIGNTSAENFTIVSLANGPGSALPATVPSAGVVTRWQFNVVPIPAGVLNQTLKVLRPTGPGQFQVVGESAPGAMASGVNIFSTRLPVQAGDHFAYFGTTTTGFAITVFCETGNPGDVAGVIAGNPTVGAFGGITEQAPGIQIPLIATIEPDVDNDGFGDETQDKCPQSAAFQTDCPVVAVDASSAIKGKGSVTVLVTTTSSAPVTVTGKVNLGKGKKANLSGGSQTVVPGTIARFTLLFPKKLKAALKNLPRKRSLKLNVTTTATDAIGRITSDALKVSLKGQAKPPKKR